MPLNLRLEIFRRINEGGTPLSPQDIRLSYYSESQSVRLIQLVGVYDVRRDGSRRMVTDCVARFHFGRPWDECPASDAWTRWWSNSKTATGQTASEMFLWYVVSRCSGKIDQILQNERHLKKDLDVSFHNTAAEVLDIVCAQFRYQDRDAETEQILPGAKELTDTYFPPFWSWWWQMRNQCASQVYVSKYRPVALLIHGLHQHFGADPLQVSDTQWGWIGKFISATRETASELGVDMPEPKGRWGGARGQRAQIDAFVQVAAAIRQR